MSVEVEEAVWGHRVDTAAQIEHELAGLRRARAAHAQEQGVSLARASVLNLVVVARRETHARRAARSVAELSGRHPSRAIVVLTDRRAEGIVAEIALRCRPPEELGRQICYEQIFVRARGGSDERIASAVIPLLLPDLPVFLWWTDTPPTDRRHFDDLLALADRFIVDSADFARPDLTLAVVHAVCRMGRGRFGVTDLNWARLTRWRELLAQLFDVPDWRPFLDGLTGVRLSFGVDADGRAIHTSQALLMLAWLASRLGWRGVERLAPSEAGGLLFELERSDGRRIRTRVQPVFERGVEEGDLTAIDIECERDGRTASFGLRRDGPARARTTVAVDGATRLSRTVHLPAPTLEDLIGEELTIVASDRVYEEALGALVALA